eukprot:TRINITY_DN3842_c1_g1_i1.p2 TRINITY_DN3842_c1_g1~~TRINITY_DN3842_c1_g1_i1.p2  ORF type:complete len:288 (+),score=66.45 TRINITY_DN3842_c1_g1_i1:195-1058(+)
MVDMQIGASAMGLAIKRGSETKTEEVDPKQARKAGKGKGSGSAAATPTAATAADKAAATPRPSAKDATGVADASSSKVANKAGKVGKDVAKEMTVLSSRLALQTAREVSLLRSGLLRAMVFKREGGAEEIVALSKATTTAFFEKVTSTEGKLAKAKLLTAHVYVWLGLLAWMEKNIESKETVQAHWEALKADATLLFEECPMVSGDKELALRLAVAEVVPVIRFKTCFEEGMSRVEIRTEGHAKPVQKVLLHHLMQKAGGVLKVGSAPKSDLERRLEKLVHRAGGEK